MECTVIVILIHVVIIIVIIIEIVIIIVIVIIIEIVITIVILIIRTTTTTTTITRRFLMFPCITVTKCCSISGGGGKLDRDFAENAIVVNATVEDAIKLALLSNTLTEAELRTPLECAVSSCSERGEKTVTKY